MSRVSLTPSLLLVAGCASAPQGSAAWLTGFGVAWKASNHRLGALTLAPTADGAEAAFVGGASTTGVWFGQEGTCNASGDCAELPIEDRSEIGLTVARAVDVPLALVSGRATLDLQGEGSTTLTLDATTSADAAVAWIGGLQLDLQRPLSAEAAAISCYDPRHGWLPTQLGVAVGAPVREGDTWQVPVSATFTGGLTFEDIRACLDAVADRAEARVGVQVVLAEGVAARALAVTQQGTWPWDKAAGDPVPGQGVDTVGSLEADLARDAVVGWQAVTWHFHEVVEPGRGAYVRSLALVADPASGQAYGHATNTALPIVLQSGFDMRFEGTLLDLDVDEEVRAGVETEAWGRDEVPAAITEEGVPVLQTLARVAGP